MKKLIVSGDDFGLDVRVNEAVEIAHRDGILTTTSLMMSGDAAADAVERARRLPKLAVGLHLVLVEGRPLLPPARVPDLVDAEGAFRRGLVAAGFRFFFSRAARRQLAAEIRAQFEAFRATGLRLDHVNAHNHMHLHPTILSLVLRIGREFGMRAVRLPREAGAGRSPGLEPWLTLMRARLRRAGIVFNDYVCGIADSGHMTEARVLALLEALPDGLVEMYFHPATGRSPVLDRAMPAYDHRGELAALVSPRVRAALARLDLAPTTFAAIVAR